jgi:hypothetical protein
MVPRQVFVSLTRLQSGTGAAYQPPHKLNRHYVKVPEFFWTKGWHAALTGAAIALLLVLLDQDLFRRSDEPFWVAPSKARELYTLSPDTWTRAIAELEDYGLVEVGRRPVSQEFGWQRVRKTYLLDMSRMEDPPIWQGL